MSRPLGANVRAACQIVADCGPCDSNEVRRHMAIEDFHNVRGYCMRAVAYGLMTIDGERFQVVQNWRLLADRVGRTQKPRRTDYVRVEKARFPRVSSVWDLGAMA
jgi:hypothetical protein